MGNTPYTVHHWATGNQYVVTWASMSSSNGSMDVGYAFPGTESLAIASSLFSDKSVHVLRTAGQDTQVVIEGSNQATLSDAASLSWAFATLSDPQGNALAQIPAVGIRTLMEAVLENCCYIRPRVSTTSYPGGGGSSGVTVHLLLSSVRSSRSGV